MTEPRSWAWTPCAPRLSGRPRPQQRRSGPGQSTDRQHDQDRGSNACHEHHLQDLPHQAGDGRRHSGRWDRRLGQGFVGRLDGQPHELGRDRARWRAEERHGLQDRNHRRRGETAASQPAGQGLPRRGDPALDRPQGPAQLAGGGLMGVATAQAEDHSELLLLRQTADLFVHDRGELGPDALLWIGSSTDRLRRDGPLAGASAHGVRPGAADHAEGHAVEPARQGTAIPERGRFPDEDQKGRLEGILDVAGIIEPSPADRQDHGTVAGDQFLERDLVAPGDEPLQERTIARARERPRPEQGPEVSNQVCRRESGHSDPLAACTPHSNRGTASSGDLDRCFFRDNCRSPAPHWTSVAGNLQNG